MTAPTKVWEAQRRIIVLTARVEELEAALREICELVEQLPSGIDEDADPDDETPTDLFAHIGGLIWQTIDAKLEHQRDRAE